MHAAGPLAWTVVETGLYFTLMSVLLVLVEGPLLSRLAKRVGEPRLALFGLVLLIIGARGFLRRGSD